MTVMCDDRYLKTQQKGRNEELCITIISSLFVIFLEYKLSGADYMRRAGSVSGAGSVCRDDCSARYYMR